VGITSAAVRASATDADKIKLPSALDEPLLIGAAPAIWGLQAETSVRVMPTSLDGVANAPAPLRSLRDSAIKSGRKWPCGDCTPLLGLDRLSAKRLRGTTP